MDQLSQPYVRRFQILQALHEYGPLSGRALRQIVCPPMSERGIQKALKRLSDHSLIIPCHGSLPKNCGHYYQLCHSEKSRHEIKGILKLIEKLPKISPFRGQDLYHSEECALWSTRLPAALPQAEVISERRIRQNKKILDTLCYSSDDVEFIPDMLIQLPNQEQTRLVQIAIEVERFTKSERRLTEKLRRFASCPSIDGVIYICVHHTNSEVIRGIYQKKVIPNTYRIKPYKDYFLLLVDGSKQWQLSPLTMSNSVRADVSLTHWIQVLAHTQVDQRRNHDFELGTGVGPTTATNSTQS